MNDHTIQDRLSSTLLRLVCVSLPASGDADGEVSRLMDDFLGSKHRTLLGVEIDCRTWLDWWDSVDQSMPPGSGPCVAAFFAYLRKQDKAPATVARTAYFIQRVFRLLGWLDADAEHEIAQVRRLDSDAAAQRKWRRPRATAFSWTHIQECIAVVNVGKENEVHSIAALLLFYDTMAIGDDVFGCKRGQEWFVWPLVRDDLVSMPDGTGILSIHNRAREDGPRTARLSKSTMKWMACSFEFRRGAAGPLFVSRSGVPLSMRSWTRIMKTIVERAGFDPASFTGTSARLGRVKDCLGEGMTVLDVCLEGNWQSSGMIIRSMQHDHVPTHRVSEHGELRGKNPHASGIAMRARQWRPDVQARRKNKDRSTRQQELPFDRDFRPEPRQLPLLLHT